MNVRVKLISVVIMPLFLLQCSSVISEKISDTVDRSVSFKELLKNPEKFRNRTVILGGEIIGTDVRKDGSTAIRIFQRPLVNRDEPNLMAKSEGRFLVYSKKFLDPYIYRKGRKITVGGIVKGRTAEKIGEMNYDYPVVKTGEIYLWKQYHYSQSIVIYDPLPGYRPFIRTYYFYDSVNYKKKK